MKPAKKFLEESLIETLENSEGIPKTSRKESIKRSRPGVIPEFPGESIREGITGGFSGDFFHRKIL